MGPETVQGRVSVLDVARRAKVSAGTVSRVLNPMQTAVPISEKTRARVLEAAKELNYRPNILARNFRSKKSQTVGVIVSDVTDPHVSRIIAGAERAIREAGYVYILSNAANSTEGQKLCVDLLSENRVDGVLMTGFAGPEEDEAIASLVEGNTPMVLMSREFADSRVPCVNLDNVSGGRMAVEYLISLGHQRIAYVAGDHYESELRHDGYGRALQAAGLPSDGDLVVRAGNTVEAGYLGMKDFLRRGAPFTGVFCYIDTVAIGVLRALGEAGFSVPRDCSVVGFDDISPSRYLTPALTTVAQPAFQMGQTGARMLIRMLTDKSSLTHRHVTFRPTLIVRESTGPCKESSSARAAGD